MKLPAASLALASTLLLVPATPAAERPDILFLFADDQAPETIAAYGQTDIDTPHLDSLVAQGTSFTRAYNMGSWSPAVCVASRAMLNTGAFLWKAEAISAAMGAPAARDGAIQAAPDFPKEGWMWSQLLGGAGYRTWFTGKWHVRADAAQVFHEVRHVRGGMPKQTPEGYGRPVDGQPDPWSPWDPKFGGFWEGGRHWSEVTADDAVDFLAEASAADSPFFLCVAFNAPHDPRQSPKEHVDRYPPSRMELPANFLPEYPYKDQIDNPATLRDEALAPMPRTEHAVAVNRGEYYALISHMDTQIGRVLEALEESGRAENTWIFFTADHGLAVGRHGFMGKQNLYEHSVRVPLVVKGPGVPAGASIEAPVYYQDIMPTTLELAGAEIPAHVEFRSLKPLLSGEGSGYPAIYGAYLRSQRSVAEGDHKLILYPRVPVARLYDLKQDPGETNDLAGDPAMAGRIRELAAALQRLQAETGDSLDLAEAFPDLF